MTSTKAKIECPNCNLADYKVVRKRLSSIKPSPENLDIYRATEDDPDINALAKSIKARGLQEPLLLTQDNFIVSGHRRYAALEEIGQVVAPCRVLPVRRDSMTRDEYLVLLREHNRQRNKTVVEQVREELIDINPDEAYQDLRRHRNESVFALEYNEVETLKIEGKKHRCTISRQKADHVKFVKQVVFTDRRSYWPLSVRAIHYALLNYDFLRNIPRKLKYKNDDESYTATSNLITRMRLTEELPWGAFTDGTRPIELFHPFSDVREFVRQELENLFSGYWRDLLQSQPNHVEVLCEKNTVYHMVLRITRKYQIPTSSGRGFNSIDPWHELFERFNDSGKKRLFVIVLSDFDPEGEMIPHVGGRTLRDDFGLHPAKFEIIKAGVTRKQIGQYGLPTQNFAKESSSNFEWFKDRNSGEETVYELEAIDPADMLADLETVIQSVLDIGLYNGEVERERDEARYLQGARTTARKALQGLIE